jgi:hypothetical protein
MGHIRLGELPRTRKWKQVVGLIEGGAGTEQLATATINAAERSFAVAAKDQGLVEAVWLLAQLPLAAQSEDFARGLRHVGVQVSDDPGLLEVVAGVTEAIDQTLPNNCGRSDMGEMAQMAAAETLTEVIGGRTRGLFETTTADVQKAFAKLGTVKRFGEFCRKFFARLSERCMNFFLSRAMSYHVGEGQRFATLAEQSNFCKAMATHCHEAVRIVEKFSGEWFSKHNWERGGISRKDTAGFTHVAMQKLVREFKEGARADG